MLSCFINVEEEELVLFCQKTNFQCYYYYFTNVRSHSLVKGEHCVQKCLQTEEL